MPFIKMSRRACLLASVVGSFSWCAHAQFATWAGPVSGSWFQPGAWIGTDTWPAGATTQAFVDAVGSPYTLTLPHMPGGLNLGTLTISSPDATVLQSAGTLTAQRMHIEAGNYTLGGGFLRSNRVTTGATGKLILKGGTVPEQTVLAGQAEMVNAATVSFQNKIQLDSGTLRLAGPTLVPSARFGGTTLSFAGNGTVLFEDGGGEFRWSTGSLTNVTVQPGVTLHGRNGQMALLGTISVSDATFTNNGNVVLDNCFGIWHGVRKLINNGTMDLDGGVINDWAMWRFENHGTLKIGRGEAAFPLWSSVFPTAINTGEIRVTSGGRLRLSHDAGVVIDNSGTIIIDGGELVVPRIANSGFVSVSNGTLNVVGSLSLADAGVFHLQNPGANIPGLFRLGGATITTNKDWYLSGSRSDGGRGGELFDGAVIGTGAAKMRLQAGQFGRTNVTIGMPFEIGSGARLEVLNGAGLANSAVVTVAGGTSSQTSNLAEVVGGSMDGEGTIVLNGYSKLLGMRTGPGITIDTGVGQVEVSVSGMTIQGTLRTATPNRPTNVGAIIQGQWDLIDGNIREANINNQGLITISGGTSVFNTFSNSGSVVQLAGTTTLRNWPGGNGSIVLNGGQFNVAGAVTLQQLAGVSINNASQTIALTRHSAQFLPLSAGTIDLGGTVMDLDQPVNAAVVLAGGSISNGTVQTTSDRVLRIAAAFPPGSTDRWQSTISNMSLDADVEVQSKSTLRLRGINTLAAGRILRMRGNFIAGAFNNSALLISSESAPGTQLTGGGAIVFDTDELNSNGGAVQLENAVLGSGITVRTGAGGGSVFSSLTAGTFQGTALAETPGATLDIGGELFFAGAGRAANGATLSLGGGSSRMTVTGPLEAGADGNLLLRQVNWTPTASLTIHGNAMANSTLNLGGNLMNLETSTAPLNLLANAFIDNGTISAIAGGTVTAHSGSSRLNNVTVLGQVMVRTGATLNLQGNWLVDGTIRGEANSTLSVTGSYPSSRLAVVQMPSPAWLRIGGTVDNSNGEIRVDADSPITQLASNVVVLGGSIFTSADRELLLSGTLDAVKFAGVGRTSETTRFRNGLALNDGTIILSAPSSSLVFLGSSQAVSGTGTVLIAPTSGVGTLSIENTLSLDPQVNLVTGGPAFIVGSFSTLSNRGTVAATGVGRVLDITTRIVNYGTLTAENSGKLVARVSSSSLVDNRGLINVGPSSLVVVRGNFVPTGSMNIDSALIHDYTTTNSLAALTAMLQTGYANGDWNGPGISSLLAAADDRLAVGIAPTTAIGSPSSFLGELTDTTTVILRNTLYGDTDLNAVVNISDFARLAANFGSAGSWASGDMNYDGVVSAADFALLAMNYNVTLNGSSAFQTSVTPRSGTTIPEPAQVVAVGAAVIMAQRRRCRAR